MEKMSIKLRRLYWEFLFRLPLSHYLFYRYKYTFLPAHLCFLCQVLGETGPLPGAIVEVGCALGHTTVFLNKHLDFLGVEKPYYAIDTFSGFTEADVGFEVRNRAKQKDHYKGYSINKKKWVDATLAANSITRVVTIEADVNQYNFSPLGEISFALIDVDLYQPVQAALKGIFPLLAPGGLIVVDDCAANNRYDGSLQAYQEFVAGRSLPAEVVLGRLGLIRTA